MKDFGSNGAKPEVGSVSSTNAGANNKSRPLSNLLQLLKMQAGAALADDAKIQREVKEAQSLLGWVSEETTQALRKLNRVEVELDEKWGQLAALLTEVKQLETERAEVLEVARQFRVSMGEALVPAQYEEGQEPGNMSRAPVVHAVAALRATSV